MHHIVHTTAFATPVVGLWLERANTSMSPQCGIDRTTFNKMSGRFFLLRAAHWHQRVFQKAVELWFDHERAQLITGQWSIYNYTRGNMKTNKHHFAGQVLVM